MKTKWYVKFVKMGTDEEYVTVPINAEDDLCEGIEYFATHYPDYWTKIRQELDNVWTNGIGTKTLPEIIDNIVFDDDFYWDKDDETSRKTEFTFMHLYSETETEPIDEKADFFAIQENDWDEWSHTKTVAIFPTLEQAREYVDENGGEIVSQYWGKYRGIYDDE